MKKKEVTIAAIQAPLGGSSADNINRVEAHVRKAAKDGAQIILPSELFELPYFPQNQKEVDFSLASSSEENAAIKYFTPFARKLGVVIPISFFRKIRTELLQLCGGNRRRW